MFLSRIAGTLGSVLFSAPVFVGTFLAAGSVNPGTAAVDQEVTISFPVRYFNNEAMACGLQVDFGDGSAPSLIRCKSPVRRPRIASSIAI